MASREEIFKKYGMNASGQVVTSSASNKVKVSGLPSRDNETKEDIFKRYGMDASGAVVESRQSASSWNIKAPSATATTPDEPTWWDRVKDTITGGAKSSLGSNMDAMGAIYEATQGQRTTRDEEQREWYSHQLERAMYDLSIMEEDNALNPGSWSEKDLSAQRSQIEQLQTALSAFDAVIDEQVQQKATTASRDLAADVSNSGAQDIERAKDGLGTFGQIVVDAGASLTQVAGDAVVRAALGGGGMLPFAMRAFGGGTQQARADGADIDEQLLYGGAIAAKEIITEKMFNVAMPWAKTYGKGSADDMVKGAIDKAVNRFASTELGKRALGGGLTLAASGVTEGLEEFFGDWLEWQLPRIYDGDTATFSEQLAQAGYDFLVGSVSGLAGGAVDSNVWNYKSETPVADTQPAQVLSQPEQGNTPAEITPHSESPMGENAASQEQDDFEEYKAIMKAAETPQDGAEAEMTAYTPDESIAEQTQSVARETGVPVAKPAGSSVIAANDVVYQAATEKYGSDLAHVVAATYKLGNTETKVSDYLVGFNKAYDAGVKGRTVEEATAAATALEGWQAQKAWQLGVEAAQTKTEVRKVERQGTGTFTNETADVGTETSVAYNNMLKLLAQKTGLDIKRVSLIRAGKEVANAALARDTMTMLLSRDSMQDVGHELSEFVEAFNPKDMDSLRADILNYWAKTQSSTSVQAMIESYQKTYQSAEGSKTTEQATAEALNDALGAILDSETGVDELMNWLQNDSGMTAQEQKSFLQKLADFFNSIIEGLKKLVNSGELSPMQVDMAHMEIEQKQDILKRLFAAVDQAAVNAKDTGEYYVELAQAGIGVDEATGTVHSLRFSTAYKDNINVGKKVFNTEAIVKAVAEGTGRSIEDARRWVESEMAIANIVMQDPEFLDFEPDERYEAIKENSDYPQGSVDLSNLCPKRVELTVIFDKLQKKYPNKLFTAEDVAEIRKILKDFDIVVACGACFVEDRRQLVGEIAEVYIGMWKEAVASGKPLQKSNTKGEKVPLSVTDNLSKQYGVPKGSPILATDKYIPTQYDLTTYEGFRALQKNHPTIAMGFERYNNSRGQQAARLIEGRAEYDRQILGWSDAKVKSVNDSGGLRIFSFSDFEVVHLLDLVQVIMDCSARGVKIQGYTKIPAFARLVRNTGIKINRSLIPKGDTGIKVVNGKRVLDIDTVEGIDINDKNFLDERDNPDVGNIIIGINNEQIGIAMLDDFVDYIIPFHSNKSKEILRKLGTGAWVNYKQSQHDKDISTGKASKHNVNIYTDVLAKYNPQNKVEFVNAFLKECKAQGKIPRYAELLNVDENGDYAYREGYHKLLVDFKMFDKEGNLLPQGNIQPELDTEFMKELLSEEVDRKKNYEFPQAVYDEIEARVVGEYVIPEGADAALSAKITRGMSEQERYDILKDRSLEITAKADLRRLADVEAKIGQSTEAAGTLHPKEKKRLFRKLGSEFGVYKGYTNDDVSLSFEFSKGGMRESTNKQGKNYGDFAKLFSCFDDVIDSAIGIEVHNRNEEGYKPDITLKDAYVLVSAFEDGDDIVPVKLEIKEFIDKENRLYVAVALERIKKDEVVTKGNTNNGVTQYARPSAVMLADLFRNVNPSDVSFRKYIPKQFFAETNDTSHSVSPNRVSMSAMTDREILAAAAEQMDTSTFTEGERDALRIFNKRLDKLGELQAKRKELGTLWHDQQFGGNSNEAVKTRNRMKVLDEQIVKAEDAVLKAKNTEVLKRVLKQARKVVAAEQKTHDDALLRRYRDRRENAESVKKYRDRIEKKVRKLTDMLLKNSDKQHIPEVLKTVVGEFLETIDFTSKRQLSGGEATKKDNKFVNTLDKIHTVLDKQAKFMQNPEDGTGLDVYLDLPEGFTTELKGYIDKVRGAIEGKDIGTTYVNMMSAEELEDLDFILGVITKSISEANKLMANARYVSVSEASENTIAYLSDVSEYTGKNAKVKKFLNWDNTTPVYAFKRLGEAGKAIFEGLMNGWDKLAINAKAVIDFAEKTYTAKEVKEWSGKLHTFELDGRTAQMSTAQIMSLYCLVKREQARGHLFGGGMRIGNITVKNKVGKESTIQQAESFHLTMEDVSRITSVLTDRQVAVAEALQQYMNTVGSKWGNQVSMARFGYNAFTEENYFPIESDSNNLPAIDPDARANDLFRLLNMCFTKSLTPKANNALVVSDIFDVFSNHMTDMAKYNALALPVLDTMKYYNYKNSVKSEEGQVTTATVQKAIERAYGNAAKSYIIQFMKDMNGVNDGGRSSAENFAMKMVGNYKVAAVGANLRVALLQPTSIVRAAAVIDTRYLAKALTMKPNAKEMLEHSGIAVWKSLGFYDTNIGRGVRDQIKHEDTIRDKVVEKSMIAAEMMDKVTWGTIWNACKLECIAKGEKDLMEATTKRFREVIYASQVVDATITRSQTMRSTSSLTKMLTSFMSEPTLSFNMLMDSFTEYTMNKRKGIKNTWANSGKQITRGLLAYCASAAAAALAESIFDALRDDDDYETFLEKFWEAFWVDNYGYDGKREFGNLAADLNPINKLPVIKDIVSHFTGYENNRMDTQWLTSITDAVSAWKSESRPLYGKIYKTLQALSRVSGLPFSNLTREVVTIYNNTIGAITGQKLKTWEPTDLTAIKEAYKGGHLTKGEAAQLLMEKKDYSAEKAQKTIASWNEK